MQRQRIIAAFVSCGIFGTFVENSAADGPSAEVCNDNGGPTICVRFDNLSVPPELGFDFLVTFDDQTGIPSIELSTGSIINQIDRQWRVWCKDAQGNPADIGSITAVAEFNFDVKILDANDGPGAAAVHDIILDPPDDKTAHLSGGNIGTLTGKLTLQHQPLTLYGQIVGIVQIGRIVAGEPPTGPQDYQVNVFGGVRPTGRLTIGELGEGVNTYIGPVYPGAYVTIAKVGARKCFGGICTRLFIQDPNEAGGDIHIVQMLPGAIAYVFPTEPPCPGAIEAECLCVDPQPALKLAVDQMDGETEEFPGALLDLRGLTPAETLTVGLMGTGAEVRCRYVAGTLNLTGEIAQGALMHLGSVGTDPCTYPPSQEHGIVDLHANNVAGTLLVDRIYPEDPRHPTPPNVSGQIINGGDVSGTGTISVVGNVVSGGSVQLANVSGTVSVGTLTLPPLHSSVSGALSFGDVSGAVIVYGDVTSGGTVTTDDVASGGRVTVWGNVASHGTLAVNHVSGTGTNGVHVQGSVSGALSSGDVSGTVSLGDVASGGAVTTEDVASSGTVTVVGSIASGGTLTTDDVGGSVTVNGAQSGSLTVGGGVTGTVQVGGDQSGTMEIQGTLVSGGVVNVGGGLKDSAQITVNEADAGMIAVAKGTQSATKIQARSGLSSGSLINVNPVGGSSETVAGTIWIGGSTTQNPMPVLTMDGTIQLNCSGGTFASGGRVKLVGCAPFDGSQADICIHGTNSGQIKQTLSCIDFFSVQCNSDCPEYP